MKQCKKTLKHTVLLGCVVFVLALAFAVSTLNCFGHRKMVYARCESDIGDVLRYTASCIDTDDLAACIRTGAMSDQYLELQKRLDQIRANIRMHFLYCVVPLNTNETDNLMNVIVAVSEEEYANQADQLVYLGMLTGNSYSPETAKKYLDAYRSGELSFFEEASEWGDDYTGLLPLKDSNGELVAALCMDMDMQEIKQELRIHVLQNFLLTVLLGAVATAFFLWWTQRDITRPIEQIEQAVTDFSSAKRDPENPYEITLKVPEIRTDNELARLAMSVEKLGSDINDYMQETLAAEQKLGRMTVIAHKDALTRVGNKAAFANQVQELNERRRQEQLKFAIVMADADHLKRINDTYGHACGDQYLKGCCQIICDVYRHSPVFRVGGDEFVAVLTGRDYYDRKNLLEKARMQFRKSSDDRSVKPWEQFSAAIGMAESTGSADESVETVLTRADREMYAAKNAVQKEK